MDVSPAIVQIFAYHVRQDTPSKTVNANLAQRTLIFVLNALQVHVLSVKQATI